MSSVFPRRGQKISLIIQVVNDLLAHPAEVKAVIQLLRILIGAWDVEQPAGRRDQNPACGEPGDEVTEVFVGFFAGHLTTETPQPFLTLKTEVLCSTGMPTKKFDIAFAATIGRLET